MLFALVAAFWIGLVATAWLACRAAARADANDAQAFVSPFAAEHSVIGRL